MWCSGAVVSELLIRVRAAAHGCSFATVTCAQNAHLRGFYACKCAPFAGKKGTFVSVFFHLATQQNKEDEMIQYIFGSEGPGKVRCLFYILTGHFEAATAKTKE